MLAISQFQWFLLAEGPIM